MPLVLVCAAALFGTLVGVHAGLCLTDALVGSEIQMLKISIS